MSRILERLSEDQIQRTVQYIQTNLPNSDYIPALLNRNFTRFRQMELADILMYVSYANCA